MPIRKPSIHIREDDLKYILIEWSDSFQFPLPVGDIVEYLMLKGKKRQILSRSILELNKKDLVKKDRVVSSATGDAQRFANTLQMVRRQHKHRGITVIREGSSDWQFIKEGTNLANNFYENFEDEFSNKDSAYTEYLNNFMEILEGPFSIRKMSALNDKVVNRFEAMTLINKQDNLQDIEDMHGYYQTKVFEKTGNNFDYRNKPEQFTHFVVATDLANKLGLSYKQYIDSQFEALDFASAIPYPQQLSNSKASERAIRWMAENNIRKNTMSSQRSKDIIQQLLKLGKKYETNPE
jgi:hypothetical protein